MKYEVFISRPTEIMEKYEKYYAPFERHLKRRKINPHRLGSNDFSLEAPLKAIIDLMEICCGAIIMGYPQYEIVGSMAIGKKERNFIKKVFPTPWNQIEGTLAFNRNIPVLVIAQEEKLGGIFDFGVTGEHVLVVDMSKKDWHKKDKVQGVLNEWILKLRI